MPPLPQPREPQPSHPPAHAYLSVMPSPCCEGAAAARAARAQAMRDGFNLVNQRSSVCLANYAAPIRKCILANPHSALQGHGLHRGLSVSGRSAKSPLESTAPGS